MKKTPNYNLMKPDQTDFYDVDDFNANADIIDAKLKELNDNKANNNSMTELKKEIATHLDDDDVHLKTGEQNKWNSAQLYKLTLDNGLPKDAGDSDPNTILKTGFYYGKHPNYPSDDFYYTEVIGNATIGYCLQRSSYVFSNDIFTRVMSAGTFSPWKKSTTAEDYCITNDALTFNVLDWVNQQSHNRMVMMIGNNGTVLGLPEDVEGHIDLLVGNGNRKRVLFHVYTNESTKIWTRTVFNNNWLGSWQVQTDYEKLFTLFGDKNKKIASAITEKGVQTNADATGDQMAANIRAIKTGQEVDFISREVPTMVAGGTASMQVGCRFKPSNVTIGIEGKYVNNGLVRNGGDLGGGTIVTDIQMNFNGSLWIITFNLYSRIHQPITNNYVPILMTT